ncbi:MAG TPA: hypothetical protein PLD84_01085 [Chitinophagales bacterium]|nr:hypothetical protein [Chitinophagales bacterium]
MRYFGLLFIMAIVSVSCKKDYTCQCTDNTTGSGTTSFTVQASSTSDAESACAEGSNTTQTCFLSN